MSLFDAYEVALLDAMFGGLGAFGAGFPATYELGLSTIATTDAGALTEPPGAAAYTRLVINNDNITFANASTLGGVTTKNNAISFTWPAATGAWGTVSHWFIYDATNAIFMVHGLLTVPKAVANGDVFKIPAGTMEITAD